MPELVIAEVFYSLQGEGARAGEPSIFVRLAGCSAKHACYEAGVRCDTEFESGERWTLDRLKAWITLHAPQAGWIIWTGGEPLDQLTPEVVRFFPDHQHAIETSGVKALSPELSSLLAWIAVSPKVAEHVLLKHFPGRGSAPLVDELRYVRHIGQAVPRPSLTARTYYLSPHSDGVVLNRENLKHCIGLCLAHPQWRLSVQQHKLWRVL